MGIKQYKEYKATLKDKTLCLRTWVSLMQHGNIYEREFYFISNIIKDICETATNALEGISWLYVGFIHFSIRSIKKELENSREYKHVDGGLAQVAYSYEEPYVFKIISYSLGVALTVIDIIEQGEETQQTE